MNRIKLLERKVIIRLFGVALLLAPLANTLVMMAMHSEIPDRWNWVVFWKVATNGSMSHHVLDIFSLLVGVIMLSGSAAAWKYVLVVLGGNIALQLAHFSNDVRGNWVSGLFFFINLSVFSFVTYQFVWKETVASPPLPKARSVDTLPNPNPASIPTSESPAKPSEGHSVPTSSTATSESKSTMMPESMPSKRVTNAPKKIPIHFDGFGPWAKLVSISGKEVHVHSIAELPFDMSHREIEIVLKNGLVLRTRLSRQAENDYYFEFISLTSNDIKSLNGWLLKQAA